MKNFEFNGKFNPYLFRRDLHSGKTIYYIEVLDRQFRGQREYFKTNNVKTMYSICDNLEHSNLSYEVFQIDIDNIIHYDKRRHIYI